jgi:hypothetical protein
MIISDAKTGIWLKRIALLLLGLLVLAIPLRVYLYGYVPPDDAMRHIAYAVDNRTWGEVLVLNPGIRADVDPHPGWHSLLRAMHKGLGFSKEDLVLVSLAVPFCMFMVSGLIGTGQILAWIGAVVLGSMNGVMIGRLMLGRPFLITEALLVVVIGLASRKADCFDRREFFAMLLALSIVLALHTSWYLWFLPIIGLILAGQWRRALILASALAGALVVGSLLVGSFYNVVYYPLKHLFLAFGHDPLRVSNLVYEFQPSAGDSWALLVMAVLLVLRFVRHLSIEDELRSPDLVLAMLGWVAGMWVARFWLDWGYPAFIVWTARQLGVLLPIGSLKLPQKILVAGCVMAAFFACLASDRGGRYSAPLVNHFYTKADSELEAAMPEPGGIIYTIDMEFFYHMYFRFPHGPWKYLVGFEPGMLPPKDLEIFRSVQMQEGWINAYAPWIDRMKPADRLVVQSVSKPEWPGMEFRYITRQRWTGRRIGIDSTDGN